MFQTKRQRRQKRLQTLSPAEWQCVPVLEGFVSFASEPHHWEEIRKNPGLTQSPDTIRRLLDDAERDADYAKALDRGIGLRTDAEDVEYAEWLKRTVSLSSIVTVALGVCVFLFGQGVCNRSAHPQPAAATAPKP